MDRKRTKFLKVKSLKLQLVLSSTYCQHLFSFALNWYVASLERGNMSLVSLVLIHDMFHIIIKIRYIDMEGSISSLHNNYVISSTEVTEATE